MNISEASALSKRIYATGKRDAGGRLKAPVVSPHSANVNALQKGDARRDIVLLNVGGTRFEVSRDTLMRYEGSMLASLISGKWKEGDGEEGEIFIDRDGRLFGFILAYLRSDRVYLPDPSDQPALKDEFEYYGIDADLSKVSHRAAMKESYRLAGVFSNNTETHGLAIRMNFLKDVDRDLLRACLISRGLHVVRYINESDKHKVDLCVIGMREQYAPKNKE